MNELQRVEYNGTLVLTTQQIAEAYETEQQIVTNNFNRNKDRYIAGKHYICLMGDELKEFRAKNQNDVLPNANKFYLWTKKGAFLHAKSLNTDTAWEVYDRLVDDYFEKREEHIEKDKPSLDAVNRAADILSGAYRAAGSDERYVALLVGSVYKGCGIDLSLPPIKMDTDKLYDQTMIATELGILSVSGKPHAQAVGAILDMLNISDEDKISTPYTNNGHSGVVIQYKENVISMVKQWLKDNDYPKTIKGETKSYNVVYR